MKFSEAKAGSMIAPLQGRSVDKIDGVYIKIDPRYQCFIQYEDEALEKINAISMSGTPSHFYENQEVILITP